MRTLGKVEEFKREAQNALFTKQQAIAVTLKLMEAEIAEPSNSDAERDILTKAMQRVSFNYLDATNSDTDALLDGLGVARLTVDDIVSAIEFVVFESQA